MRCLAVGWVGECSVAGCCVGALGSILLQRVWQFMKYVGKLESGIEALANSCLGGDL